MVTFSCGCSGDMDDGIDIAYKSYSRDNLNSVTYAFVCKNCVCNYELLNSITEEEEWLNDKRQH